MRMFSRILLIFFTCNVVLSTNCKAQETIIDQVDKAFLDTLIALARKNYPRVKYYQYLTTASKESLKTQKNSWFQPLTFSYVYNPTSSINAVNPVFLSGIQLGLFLNIGSFIQKPSEIRKAKAELKAVESEEAEYNISIATEVRKRYFDYILQLNMLGMYTKTLLDAKAMLTDISSRYQKSEISFEEYSKALIVVNGNIQSKLETESHLLAAKVSLEELVGVKLDELEKDGTR